MTIIFANYLADLPLGRGYSLSGSPVDFFVGDGNFELYKAHSSDSGCGYGGGFFTNSSASNAINFLLVGKQASHVRRKVPVYLVTR